MVGRKKIKYNDKITEERFDDENNIFENFAILFTYLYITLLNLSKFLHINNVVCTYSHLSLFSIRI